MEQFKHYQFQEEASGLQMHSVGVVVEDSATGEIEVSPLEKLNTQEAGHIKSKSRLLEAKLPGEKKEAVSASIKSKDTVSATWLAVTGGNRVTAPHMFKNELVMLWRFANDPKYYWSRLNSDNPGLRRAEQAVYKWSNADKEAETVLSDLGYTLDVNAVEGYVKFTNDKGKNENAVADILLDFKSGFIEVSCENVTLKIDGAGDSVTIKAKTVLVDSEEVTVTGDLKVLGKVGAEGFSGKTVKADSGTFGKLKVGKLTTGSMEKTEDEEIGLMPASYAKGTATIPAAGRPVEVGSKVMVNGIASTITSIERGANGAVVRNFTIDDTDEYLRQLESGTNLVDMFKNIV